MKIIFNSYIYVCIHMINILDNALKTSCYNCFILYLFKTILTPTSSSSSIPYYIYIYIYIYIGWLKKCSSYLLTHFWNFPQLIKKDWCFYESICIRKAGLIFQRPHGEDFHNVLTVVVNRRRLKKHNSIEEFS